MHGRALAGVDVPASSANLGPGFDALAVAVGLHLRVCALPPGGALVRTTGQGAGELPEGPDNLVWRALDAFCRQAGTDVPDVTLEVDNEIPLERGLGSSAAAAIAGLALGRALTGVAASDVELVRLAAGLEGHADNAAAALLGGLVLCEGERIVRLEPSAALAPVLCVPEERSSTRASRKLLREGVPLADAAANGARVAGVVAGLVGLTPLAAATMTDVLHEPARLAAMTSSGRLVSALREAGVPACLSGAGPSVLAVVPAGAQRAAEVATLAGGGWQVHASVWNRTGAVAWTDGDVPGARAQRSLGRA